MFGTTQAKAKRNGLRMTSMRVAGRTGALVAGMALALGLAMPATAALAEEDARIGSNTTLVTVVASDTNLRFKVPTVIPFVAASDGTLTGPSPEATKIENLSAFGLKVTNVKVSSENGWSHSSDVNSAENSIDWKLGPKGAMVRAAGAASESGTAITDPLWNMTYYSNDTTTDDIQLERPATSEGSRRTSARLSTSEPSPSRLPQALTQQSRPMHPQMEASHEQESRPGDNRGRNCA